MSLNEFMLSNTDMLESIDLSVDFFGNEASVEEHGDILLDVNSYELCAQSSLPTTEWWPMTACMFSMQACLTNDGKAGMTCAEVAGEAAADEEGVADDLNWASPEVVGDDCECSLNGVATFCADAHASRPWADVHAACDVATLAKESSARAVDADDGATMWVTINDQRYTYDEGAAYGGTNTNEGFGAWAGRVMGVACQAIKANGQATPASCDDYLF